MSSNRGRAAGGLGGVLLVAAVCGGCPGVAPVPGTIAFNLPEPPAAASLPAGEAVFAAATVFSAAPDYAGCHAPTITALPDGTLLAAWYAYAGPGELDGADVFLARRPPGGATWSLAERVARGPIAEGNPVLFSRSGRVWLFYAVVPGGWSTAHVEFRLSDDSGQSWSSPSWLPGPLGTNVRGAPVVLADETLLLPAYDDLQQRALFFHSNDGLEWALRSYLVTAAPHRAIQPSVTVLSDGGLLAVLRNTGGGWLWVTASDDDGWTWRAPADAGFANPGSPATLLRLASGHLLLILNPSASERRPLAAMLSADEGRTWLPPRTLADGAGEYAYPAAVQSADGLVHVVYSHERAEILELTVNERWVAGG